MTNIDGLRAEDYLIDSNSVFKEFNDDFVKVFMELDRDDAYSSCYVPKALESVARISTLIPPAKAAEDRHLGEVECDILWFAAISDLAFLCLQGPVGSGKSTALASTSRAINYHNLRDRIELQVANFNVHIDALNDLYAEKQSARPAIIKIIRDRLLKAFANKMTIANDAFWSWLFAESTTFAEQSVQLASRKERYKGDADRARAEELAIRDDCIRSPDCLWEYTRFAHSRENFTLIMATDNIDPLHHAVQTQLINIVKELSECSAVRFVIPMRPETFHRVRVEMNHLRFRSTQVQAPGFDQVLTRRTGYLKEKVEHALTTVHAGAREQWKSRVRADLSTIIGMILDPHAISTIQNLANHDLRVGLSMTMACVGSGHLDRTGLLKRSVDPEMLADPSSLIIAQPIVTWNCKTYFPSRRIATIMNVWCDGLSHYPWNHFFYAHILRYFEQSRGTVPVSKAVDEISTSFAAIPDAKATYSPAAVKRAIGTLISVRLLHTPVVLYVSNVDQLPNDAPVHLSQLGKYYTEQFMYSIEYVGYMKDCVRLDSDATLYGCAAQDRLLILHRIEDSLLFTAYLHSKEKAMLDCIFSPSDQRAWRCYVDKFATRSNGLPVLYSSKLLNELSRAIDVCVAHCTPNQERARVKLVELRGLLSGMQTEYAEQDRRLQRR
ncbi:MAG: hypothetical protein AABZ53_05055 [Planctomycetota bacterium]